MAPPLPPLRSIAAIRTQLDELATRESQAQSPAERAAVAVAMTELFLEIKRDPRLVASGSLQVVQQRLRGRLLRIKKDVLAKMKRDGVRDETLTDAEVLAMADAEYVTQSLTDHFSLASATLGGPATLFNQAHSHNRPVVIGARGGGTAFDYGPALVDLIQRTIVPDFWDVNGGKGTIVYYRPLLCLVVRATSEVHHRIGGTLDALGAVK
jgi:hypothetical protein